MVVFANRVAEISTTAGTGNMILASAVPGYQRFASALSVGDECGYTIVDDATGDFECGTGTLVGASQLRRDAVSASSNAGALVNFGAGNKVVALVTLAEDQSMDAGTF